MNFKQKLAYMAIGCVFTLAGYFLAILGTGGVNPQTASAQASDKQIIDEIVCRKLKVVNPDGKTVVSLEPVVNGGSLEIYNDAGRSIVDVGALFDGNGRLLISDKDGTPTSGMFADNAGGSISILKIIDEKVKEVATLNGDGIVCQKLRVVNSDDVTVARLEAFRTGGAGIVLYNKEGERVFWVSSSGEGSTLSMFNEAGERTIWIWSASHGGGHLLLCNDAGTKLFGVRSYDVVDDEFDFGGGLLQLYNRVGDSRVKINGKNGEVTTWDKQGNETGRLPR